MLVLFCVSHAMDHGVVMFSLLPEGFPVICPVCHAMKTNCSIYDLLAQFTFAHCSFAKRLLMTYHTCEACLLTSRLAVSCCCLHQGQASGGQRAMRLSQECGTRMPAVQYTEPVQH